MKIHFSIECISNVICLFVYGCVYDIYKQRRRRKYLNQIKYPAISISFLLLFYRDARHIVRKLIYRCSTTSVCLHRLISIRYPPHLLLLMLLTKSLLLFFCYNNEPMLIWCDVCYGITISFRTRFRSVGFIVEILSIKFLIGKYDMQSSSMTSTFFLYSIYYWLQLLKEIKK